MSILRGSGWEMKDRGIIIVLFELARKDERVVEAEEEVHDRNQEEGQ